MSLYEYFDTVFFPIRICLRLRIIAAFRQVASLRAKHSSDRLRTAGTSLANKDRSPTTLRGKVSFNKSWLSKTNLQPLSIVSRSVQSLFNPSAINTLWITSVISVSTSDTYILRYSNSKRQNKQHGIYTCTIFTIWVGHWKFPSQSVTLESVYNSVLMQCLNQLSFQCRQPLHLKRAHRGQVHSTGGIERDSGLNDFTGPTSQLCFKLWYTFGALFKCLGTTLNFYIFQQTTVHFIGCAQPFK